MDPIERMLDKFYNYGRRTREEDLERAAAKCESPLESRLLICMGYRGWHLVDASDWTEAHRFAHLTGTSKTPKHVTAMFNGHLQALMLTQAQITSGSNRWRADCAIFVGRTGIVVELDGHPFHERTADQVLRDRSRDRAMTIDGWKVLRFTGREVHSSVMDVAIEIADACEVALEEYERSAEFRKSMGLDQEQP